MLRIFIIFVFLVCSPVPLPVYAQDMRVDHMEAEKQRRSLEEKARQEAAEARQEAERRHQQILSDRSALVNAVRKVKQENVRFRKEVEQLETQVAGLKEEEEKLQEELAATEAVTRELSGFIRGYAKDLDTLLTQSPQSAMQPERGDFLPPMINQSRFPSMDDVHRMADLLFDEIRLSGAVRLTRKEIVDRQGHETPADILMLGNFTAVYRTEKESGFLLYSEKSRRLLALSRLPRNRVSDRNEAYMNGKTDGVYLDITKGAALRQLTHELSLLEQIPHGGPIVWPLLLLLVVAVAIIGERIVFLRRKSLDAEDFTQTLCRQVAREDWSQCETMCRKHEGKSVPKVLQAGLDCREMDRIDMENALQEAILNEIPSLERFLSTLGMLAAIAPLLGLLGTVTGMINTFHVITYQGTGDPRLMSGGISEALVTTMLGLCVAIPIMLAHTLLSRKVENLIGEMEEKAVSFVNQVFRNR